MSNLLDDGALTIGPGSWGQSPRAYRCHLAIIREAEGFSILILNLPGVGSQGDTVEDALANVKEALLGAIESYRAAGESIPWKASGYAIPEGAESRWILVHG